MEVCSPEDIKTVLARYGLGYLSTESDFFKNGNACLPKFNKHGVIRDYEDIAVKGKSK